MPVGGRWRPQFPARSGTDVARRVREDVRGRRFTDMAGSRPRGDEASDAARWWRAYCLADSDQVDELRELAAAGDEHARRQLASWLSERAFP